MTKAALVRAEPWAQYILFTILVMATPFVVVTRFLQGAVWRVSHIMFPLFGLELPVVGTFAIALLIAVVVWQRRNITRRKIIAGLVIVSMIAISQWVQDLYGGMSVYDLQKNWHYAAYSCYVFIFFRAFNRIKMPLFRMIPFAFLSAIVISFIDEGFQYNMSNRIFDVSDISKDAWGAMMGLVMVLFIAETYGSLKIIPRLWWKRRVANYFQDPMALLIICGLLALSAILMSPLLTGFEYWHIFLGFTLGLFLIIVIILHLLQFPKIRIVILSLLGAGFVVLLTSFILNIDKGITRTQYGLTVYKGLPVPFFDMMIYPNGMPRLVDKKHLFNQQDKNFLFSTKPDILLMGAGFGNLGGKGFPISEGSTFVFNQSSKQGTQVIIYPTPLASQIYNRLIKEGKKVLFVIHNTC
ncbi:MAG: hypothetical protein FJY65_03005 [Calditrichaeota bacterium]|nr:hypothetical protein [Calditrichota bacterium]